MLEPNNPDIDVRSLAESIHREVQNRSFTHQPGHLAETDDSCETNHPIPEQGESHVISQLENHHDAEFIRNSYRIILERDPDASGFSFYHQALRQGKLTKIDVLGRLRYSPEGRSRRVKIRGLLFPFILHSIFRLPLLGYVLRWACALLRLPRQPRHVREANEYFYTKLDELSRQMNASQSYFSEMLRGEAYEREGVFVQLKKERAERLAFEERLLSDPQFWEGFQKRLLDVVYTRKPKPTPETQRHDLDWLYAEFEKRFRGSTEELKNRARIYLPKIKEIVAVRTKPVLDLGCGRGDWLELLKSENIPASGVDINRAFVQECRARQMDVEEKDIFDFLRSLPGNSLSALTGFHIIEHLPLEKLAKLFEEATRTLVSGGIVIFETPNPQNILVGSHSFYNDPTHLRPVPSLLSKFLAEIYGLIDVEIMELHPYEDSHKIKSEESELSQKFNQFFYGPQDYAVIGYKK